MDNDIKKFCDECIKRETELSLGGSFEDSTSEGKEYTYNSIVFCLLDAVFSIGVNYKSVENTVNRYANYYDLDLYDESHFDEHKISDFIKNYEDFSAYNNCECSPSFGKCILENKQNTSSKNGILKSEACYEIAKILRDEKIETLADIKPIINKNDDKYYKLKEAICNVKGQSSGIMFKYFCMLSGDENTCKPDRWIKDFLCEIKMDRIKDDNDEIIKLFQEACKELKTRYPNITPRYLDYKIWSYQRNKSKRG